MVSRSAVVTSLIVLTGLAFLSDFEDSPEPHEMEPNEQREWARDTLTDWTDYSVSATAQFSQEILDSASQICLRADLGAVPDQWEELQQEALGAHYVAYSVECPETLQDFEVWLDQTGNRI